ncbi:hypothetical protein BB400_01740 [Helicobacter pylori]|nr:hypothetical protein BB400_01740 [Helicobacter pylori]
MGSWFRILLSILVVVLGLALTTMLINWHV